jgi:hypothetical protein
MGFGRLQGVYRWPGGVIPFEIDEATFPTTSSATAIGFVTTAVAHWNTNTLIRLQARQGEPDYVVFVGNVARCTSPAGRQGGRQIVSCAQPR